LNIGENIKFGRKLHGFSQSDLSNKLKVSSNSVSNWERGTAEPTLTALIKLSRLFKVLIDDLLTKDLEAEGFEVGSPFQLAIVTLNNHNVLVPAEDFKDYCGWNDAIELVQAVIPGIQGKALTFEVANDSMAPLLMWGDWAVCAPVEQAKGLEVGRIFVVVTQGSEVVFGYAQNFKEGVKVMPHNQAGHAWHMIPYDQVFEVWQVKMRLTKHFMLPYMVGDVGSSQANEPGSRKG